MDNIRFPERGRKAFLPGKRGILAEIAGKEGVGRVWRPRKSGRFRKTQKVLYARLSPDLPLRIIAGRRNRSSL
jgi:hypothetical protein